MPLFSSVATNGKAKKPSPDKPTLTYSADGQFTISNYNAAYNYTVTGASRSGATLSSVTNGATITVSWSAGSPQSAAATMNVQAHGRVLTTQATTVGSAGCGSRPTACCPGGTITDTAGNTCGSGGTQGCFAECSGNCSCPAGCFGLFVACWNWYWTDYSGSGYTLIGNTWGKSS